MRYVPLVILILIVALPFAMRRVDVGTKLSNDPSALRVTIVTPHNEAIRYEFEVGFSRWHQQKYGKPVRIDWRNIGGTTEISRYLASEYVAAVRAWRKSSGAGWPENASETLLNRDAPTDPILADLWKQYRATDNPDAFTCKIDLFFGGGEYDHSYAFRSGFTVAPWPEEQEPDSLKLIPKALSGEVWRTSTLYGTVVSTFGIAYNVDRLKDLGVTTPPRAWSDLADPIYFGQVGVADPTKSGSIAKAFEMIVHQQMHESAAEYLRAQGIAADDVDSIISKNEQIIAAFSKSTGAGRGVVPPELNDYQAALEAGWDKGLRLIQLIGANARYFTDAGSKVPIDVGAGDAAVGMCIDFYARFQAQMSRAPDGTERMIFITPRGGTSVSCDPISLLRGAPNRETAAHFIEYLMTEDAQKLWTYKPGSPGGPEKFALRRLPLRRDFYPSEDPQLDARAGEHRKYSVDALDSPDVDPFQVAETFMYYRRWTGDHFNILRDIVRAMCMDSGDELREAWKAINRSKDHRDEAMKALQQMPTARLKNLKSGQMEEVPLTWRTAPDIRRNYEQMQYMKNWAAEFRENYQNAKEIAEP